MRRHQLGQWFTPEPVAELALRLALRGEKASGRVLDPSCGDGAFLSRARALGIEAGCLCGVDIDPAAIAAARSALPGVELVEGDFFEVEPGNFDVVVGNPPYVRQERLDTTAKTRMVERLASDWPFLGREELHKLVGRSDLAAPFLLRALRHLQPGRRAALVISSAFFDSGYGAQFWKLLARVASLELVVDAPEERWFADAAVNAVIAVFRAGPAGGRVCFARLEGSAAKAAQLLASGGEIAEVAELRYAPQNAPETWASTLRAPRTWLEFEKSAEDVLTTLGAVAEIRRGITSGANEIFYMKREQARERDLPGHLLRPILRTPGKFGHGSIRIEEQRSADLALVVPRDTQLDRFPGLARYLRSFPGASQRRSLALRDPWWSLSVRPSQVFLSKAYGERFVQPFSETPLLADQRIYCVHPVAGIEPELLAAVLNATPTALAIESLGRASMGQGALEWTVKDAAHLPILDPRKLRDPGAVLAAFRRLSRRPVGSAADEVGRPDRQQLDQELLSLHPSLVAQQSALQEALVATSRARQRRARR